jgi:hypothetical protein
MKFRHEIVINADQDAVWAAFEDPENIKGTVAKLVYEENGRKIMLTETITERREPHFLAGTYESPTGSALIVNHFEDAGDGRTRWAMYGNHSFKGILRVIGIFFAGSIRKRNEEMMNNFKLLAETKRAERRA